VSYADQAGRPPLEVDDAPLRWFRDAASEHGVDSTGPAMLVTGRLLIDELGMTQGPAIGEVLRSCFEAQLDGTIVDVASGLAFARQMLGATE
jgi:hypothetical protein